jgi:hypothetical protein
VNRYGIDYVRVVSAGGEGDVPVIIGTRFDDGGAAFVEVLSGLSPGDSVVVP